MNPSKADLTQGFERLPPAERAAAIGHVVYALTARRTGWSLRVPERWQDVQGPAREQNIAMVQTWLERPDLVEAWVAALRASSSPNPGGP